MGDDSKPLIPEPRAPSPAPAPLPKIPSLPPRDTEQIAPLADCRDTAEVAPLDLAALTRELDTRTRQGPAPATTDVASLEPATAASGELGSAAAAAPAEEGASPSTASEVVEPKPADVATAGADENAAKASADPPAASAASSSAAPVASRAGAHLTTAAVRPLRDPRPIVIGAAAVAGICVVATIGTIVWARNAVARAERSAAERTAAQVAVVAASTPGQAAAQSAPSAPPPAQPVEPAQRFGADPAAKPVVAAAAAPAGTCSIAVRANVAGASVWVDGNAKGAAPQTIAAPCDTTARVVVRHPRYEEFRREVTVRGTVDLQARLERAKTELTVWSQPPGAEVTYNGAVLGKTPLVAKVNRYEQGILWLRAPGYGAQTRKVVAKEQNKLISVKLNPIR